MLFYIVIACCQKKKGVMMSTELCIILIVGSLLFCIYVLRKIRYSQYKIEDSIFWICFSFILVFFSIFPGILTEAAKKLGVMSPVNFIFLLIIFLLILKIFLLSRKVSELEEKLKQLVQKMAKEKELERKKK